MTGDGGVGSVASLSLVPTGEPARRAPAVFFGIGSVFVVLGGLVAAVTGPLKLSHGSWLAAYLVLVCGVAQCAFGLAERHLVVTPVRPGAFRAQLICWNAGNAAVVAGTLTAVEAVVDVGGALLVIPLVLTVLAVRNSPHRLLRLGCIAVMGVLAVSIPVGLVLSYLRHG